MSKLALDIIGGLAVVATPRLAWMKRDFAVVCRMFMSLIQCVFRMLMTVHARVRNGRLTLDETHGSPKKRLDALGKRADAAWSELEALVEKSAYEEAIRLATDLRGLALRDGATMPLAKRCGSGS